MVEEEGDVKAMGQDDPKQLGSWVEVSHDQGRSNEPVLGLTHSIVFETSFFASYLISHVSSYLFTTFPTPQDKASLSWKALRLLSDQDLNLFGKVPMGDLAGISLALAEKEKELEKETVNEKEGKANTGEGEGEGEGEEMSIAADGEGEMNEDGNGNAEDQQTKVKEEVDRDIVME